MTKVRLGKLPSALDLVSDFPGETERQGFELLSLSTEDCVRAGLLPGHRKDPFDRLLISQSQAASIPIVSNEALFDLYGVRRIW